MRKLTTDEIHATVAAMTRTSAKAKAALLEAGLAGDNNTLVCLFIVARRLGTVAS